MKFRTLSIGTALACSVAASFTLYCAATGPMVPLTPAIVPLAPKKIEIDLDKATPIKVPKPKFDLKATVFATPDNRQGWAINLPGGRPIATPAFWQGMIFVGGGYGSHEFYAFDAQTGKLDWQYKTSDDGPTAAVVEEGYCAFNTESCTVFVLNAKTGKLVWQEWLGDPLMSQPAIWNGRLYIAYPSDGGGQNSHAHMKPNTASLPPGHRMLCADLKTGKHLWEAPITSDVISAPILSGGKTYFSCQDGTSFCLDALTGKLISQKADASTSAPTLADGKLVVMQKSRRGKETMEGMRIMDGQKEFIARNLPAAYLSTESVAGGSAPAAMPVAGLSQSLEKAQDASVGFASPPASAGLDKIADNLPVKSVVAGWAYQGSRAAYNKKKGLLLNAQGATINSTTPDGKGVNWMANAHGKNVRANAQTFSPPALGKDNIYLVSGQGNMLAVDQSTGKVLFDYSTKEPMSFQPALAHGNMYVGTSDGRLICLKTGLQDADDWSGWGGNAQHNKD